MMRISVLANSITRNHISDRIFSVCLLWESSLFLLAQRLACSVLHAMPPTLLNTLACRHRCRVRGRAIGRASGRVVPLRELGSRSGGCLVLPRRFDAVGGG